MRKDKQRAAMSFSLGAAEVQCFFEGEAAHEVMFFFDFVLLELKNSCLCSLFVGKLLFDSCRAPKQKHVGQNHVGCSLLGNHDNEPLEKRFQ